MDENPYQSPAEYSVRAPLKSTVANPNALYRVDGRHLIVTSDVVLPPFCVKTGEPISEEDYQREHYTWCSPFLLVLVLINVLIAIFFYLILRKHCWITFGVTPGVQRKYRKRVKRKLIGVGVVSLSLPFAEISNYIPAIVFVIVLIIAALVAVFLGNSPLAIKKHHKGEFWVTGCCPEFLEKIPV